MVTTAEKAAAASAYVLPLLDGFPYGVYVYQNVEPVGNVAFSLLPYVNAFQSLPFAGLILFFGLSFFTRNQGLSRFVRFNIQQAPYWTSRFSFRASSGAVRTCSPTSCRRWARISCSTFASWWSATRGQALLRAALRTRPDHLRSGLTADRAVLGHALRTGAQGARQVIHNIAVTRMGAC